jgi:hypothetical protein
MSSSIVYTIYAKRQWRVMKESNEINRDALQSVQRAYVNFSTTIDINVMFDPITHKVDSWNFMIPVENSGTTPTRGMTAHVERYESKGKMPDDFAFPDTPGVPSQLIVLGPKANTRMSPVGVRPESIEALESIPRGWHVYFYGWAKYHDVFARTPEHITKFCYELAQINGSPYAPKAGEKPYTYYETCPRHNCTDEECKAEK